MFTSFLRNCIPCRWNVCFGRVESGYWPEAESERPYFQHAWQRILIRAICDIYLTTILQYGNYYIMNRLGFMKREDSVLCAVKTMGMFIMRT